MSDRSQIVDVAVIIPTYNHARFLGAALDSVLSQTRVPREIIVIDDGSTDDPAQVTRSYPQVHLIRQENRGLAAARNAGLRASTAGNLLFLDADDQLLPHAVEYGMSLLEGDPEAAFAYSAYEIVNSAGSFPAEFRAAPRLAFRAFLADNLIGMHATVLYRRAPLEAVSGFCESLRACEDYDLFLRLSELFPVVCGASTTAQYWHHGANMSQDSGMMLKHALAVLDLSRARAERAGAMADYRAGQVQWKSFYSTKWIRAVRAGPNLSWWKQGVQIAAMAPRELATAALSSIGKVLRR